MTVPQKEPFDSLVFLTNRVARLLSIEVRKRLEEDDGLQLIHANHIGVLVDLWMQDGVRQQDLAVSTIKDKGTITRMLNFLEKENLVVRVKDRSDKRNKLIYLTHRGKELKHELLPYAQTAISKAVSGIAEEELRTCKDVLARVYKNLITPGVERPDE